MARVGAIDGSVRTDAGEPVAGAAVLVSGPGGDTPLATDADGAFSLSGLAPGTYTITLTAPEGTTVVGESSRTVVITTAAELHTEQDLVVRAEVTTPPPTPTPTPPTGEDGGSGPLPATGLDGADTAAWAWAGALMIVVASVMLVTARRRARRD